MNLDDKLTTIIKFICMPFVEKRWRCC